ARRPEMNIDCTRHTWIYALARNQFEKLAIAFVMCLDCRFDFRHSQRLSSLLFALSSLPYAHSYRSDSMGSRRAAFQAGHNPKIMPMPTLARKPAAGAHKGTYDGMISFTSRVSNQPIAKPTNPPKPVSVIASIRNCQRMSLRRAPMALRTPISRVRS